MFIALLISEFQILPNLRFSVSLCDLCVLCVSALKVMIAGVGSEPELSVIELTALKAVKTIDVEGAAAGIDFYKVVP